MLNGAALRGRHDDLAARFDFGQFLGDGGAVALGRSDLGLQLERQVAQLAFQGQPFALQFRHGAPEDTQLGRVFQPRFGGGLHLLVRDEAALFQLDLALLGFIGQLQPGLL
jgi:hypothetical protein